MLSGSIKDIYSDSLVEVLLYGSHARGDYNEDSDIDLVAIVHGNRLELQKKLDLVWDVSSELELKDVDISPIVLFHFLYKENEYKTGKITHRDIVTRVILRLWTRAKQRK